MKLFLSTFILILFLTGCSKRTQVIHKLDGNWEIVSYKQTYLNGLTSTIASDGNFTFSGYKYKKEDTGDFSYDQSYTINGTTILTSEKGTYSLSKKAKDIVVTLVNPDGSYQTERNYSINILTTTDLKLEVVFNNIFHTYVLKKK